MSWALGESLRAARQLDFDEYSPPAFDVCTDKEAKAIDVREKGEKARRRQSTDSLPIVLGRGEANGAVAGAEARGRRADVFPGDA